jgi:hypothetical protein
MNNSKTSERKFFMYKQPKHQVCVQVEQEEAVLTGCVEIFLRIAL